MTTQCTRPSLLVGMDVRIIQNEYEKSRSVPVKRGKIVDILFTCVEDNGGLLNDRVKAILVLDNGRLREAYINQLEKDSD